MDDLKFFDLLTVIRDTDKPFIIEIDKHPLTTCACTFRELALSKTLINKDVHKINIDVVNGQPTYVVNLRG